MDKVDRYVGKVSHEYDEYFILLVSYVMAVTLKRVEYE